MGASRFYFGDGRCRSLGNMVVLVTVLVLLAWSFAWLALLQWFDDA